MSRIRRWQRICILCLLSLSVITPIFLVSYRLKSLTPGRREFVEDLSDMKYRADVLKLSAIEQEDRDGIKEPNQEVYRDGNYSIVKHILNEDSELEQSRLMGEQSANSETNGKDTVGKQEVKQAKSEEVLLSNGGKVAQLNQTIHHDQRVKTPQVKAVQHRQDTQVQRRRPADERVKHMKDQLVTAKAYLSFSVPASHSHLAKELRQRTKELERALGDARKDSELPRSAVPRIRNMEATLSKASRVYPDCSSMVRKLRAMMQSAEDQVQAQKQQSEFLIRLVGRTTSKGHHCVTLRLTEEFFTLGKQKLSNQQKYNDPKLFHIAVFSDNILAATVVVNSTVSNAKDPKKIVFHVITDSLNFPAMSTWFILNPPGKAAVQVLSIDDFQWLPKDYDTLLEKQKSLDPRYGSPLNHLRFYLPEIFPRLNKILLLDHDVVVQRDLSRLWSLNMKQKVNGAVQTCQEGKPSHVRMDTYIDFSQPLLAKNFNPDACTWAFGMNFFDLKEWKRLDLSGKYNDFLVKGNEKPLWKAGSLPLGWLTFDNHTLPLDPKWHLLGLGYESGVSPEEIEEAAVIHYDGTMKPWLDIGIRKYKGYWNKYLDFNHPYLQRCNIHG